MTKCKVCKYSADESCGVKLWIFNTEDANITYPSSYQVIGCKDGGKSLIIKCIH